MLFTPGMRQWPIRGLVDHYQMTVLPRLRISRANISLLSVSVAAHRTTGCRMAPLSTTHSTSNGRLSLHERVLRTAICFDISHI